MGGVLILAVTGAVALTPAAHAANPTEPPARICGNQAILDGPASPPPGAITVPAGNHPAFDTTPGATYWFAPGVHTLGRSEFGQIIPSDDNTFIGAPGAILDGKHRNRYAFTQHATGVTISHLTIRNFGAIGGNMNEGVVNHDAGDGWTIEFNTVTRNAGAGVFVGSGNVLANNCLALNGQYGFSAYEPGGVSDVVISRNEIVGNNTYDWESHIEGCGCTGGGKFWDTDGATIKRNWVHRNHGAGIWADTNNNDFLFSLNYIDDNEGPGIEYEISYNARILENTLIRNALVDGPANSGFPTAAVYLSEAGGDARVPARWSTTTVSGNLFRDNWSGVVLWENSDRFCGSPANTSTDSCTLVDPAVSNLTTCAPGTIDDEPYYSDCRWKTQNVRVNDNRFIFDPARIPGCAGDASCGAQGIFANYGTYPSWSPYQGTAVEEAITFDQNNRFDHNNYTGPWSFWALEQGNVIDVAAWRAPPYAQDAGSIFK